MKIGIWLSMRSFTPVRIAPVVCVALAVAAAALSAASAAPAAVARQPTPHSTEDLTKLVRPLAGTVGAGFPMLAAGRPFGMAQPGPDTSLPGNEDPVNYAGYAYQDPLIRGFSLTHFDGPGIHIAGDLPFMPTTGSVTSADALQNASPYSHARELAQPGYYSVSLLRYETTAELTATNRAAMMHFTYPAGAQANLLLYGSLGINGSHVSSVSVVGDDELRGSMTSDVGYPLHFDARFDRPFRAFGTFNGAALAAGSRAASGSSSGAWVSFDTAHTRSVTMRVAISYADAAGATRNLARELPSSESFGRVRRAAQAAWNSRLHDVYVAGGDSTNRKTFYTSLYRALTEPALFDDSDGRYRGLDGATHKLAPGSHHYSNLSEWDIYRSQFPLLELIEPSVARDVVSSLLDDYDQNHQALPRWVQANVDRGIMGGDSATPIVADAVMNGLLTGSQAARAYAALLHQAMTLPPVWAREHLDAYLAKGYIGNEVSGIGAAETLEYAIDDASVAQVAQKLGHQADASAFLTRAASWRNLLDPSSHFMRPRNSDGSWANPTSQGPLNVPWSPNFQDGYQEGTGWQYQWYAPQDVTGLARAIGSPAATIRRLDRFFSTPLNHSLITAVPIAQQYGSLFGVYYIGNQYTPANEPDLWTPWYYDWLGQPWKTQRIVRAEMGTYSARPDGLPGNDDAGEMSAWYVLAALGLYHVTPGVPAWELNSPAFPLEQLRLGPESAQTFEIRAPQASAAAPYVQQATLAGTRLTRTYLTTCELRTARSMTLRVSKSPTGWGTGAGAAPPSLDDRGASAPIAACR